MSYPMVPQLVKVAFRQYPEKTFRNLFPGPLLEKVFRILKKSRLFPRRNLECRLATK